MACPLYEAYPHPMPIYSANYTARNNAMPESHPEKKKAKNFLARVRSGEFGDEAASQLRAYEGYRPPCGVNG